MAVKVILLDLDGTLLNSAKTISPANYAALERAAAAGVHIVPATGRFYKGMPQVVRDLPFVRYAVSVNGAEIYDRVEDKVLHREELDPDQALAIYDYLTGLPALCDAYVDGWGYMDRKYYDRMEEFSAEPYVLKMFRELRTPVDDMRGLLTQHKAQKVMAFFNDMDRRALELERVKDRFPNAAVSSSISNNIEVNAKMATKGGALLNLCAVLGIDVRDSMAFGDGSNDLAMIQNAGIGVAMGNAYDGLKAAADFVTLTCDEDGVAHAINKFVFGE